MEFLWNANGNCNAGKPRNATSNNDATHSTIPRTTEHVIQVKCDEEKLQTANCSAFIWFPLEFCEAVSLHDFIECISSWNWFNVILCDSQLFAQLIENSLERKIIECNQFPCAAAICRAIAEHRCRPKAHTDTSCSLAASLTVECLRWRPLRLAAPLNCTIFYLLLQWMHLPFECHFCLFVLRPLSILFITFLLRNFICFLDSCASLANLYLHRSVWMIASGRWLNLIEWQLCVINSNADALLWRWYVPYSVGNRLQWWTIVFSIFILITLRWDFGRFSNGGWD